MYQEYKAYLKQKEFKMEYNFLSPNCGLKVSAICLGAMTFQKSKTDFILANNNINMEDSFKILDRFVELGGNFIDTANVYAHGQSEEVVGEWMKQRGNRSNMVIATKVFFSMGGMVMDPTKPNNVGLSRVNIMQSVEDSLRRLQTDYIDLYQIHAPDEGTPIAEVVRTMDDLVRAGKIRYVGACNMNGWQMQKVVDTVDKLGCNPWVTLQSHYSLLGRYEEKESFTVCKNEGLGLMPWGAVKGGLLTGKLKRDDKAPPAGSRLELASQIKMPLDNFPDFEKLKQDDNVWKLVDKLKEIGTKHGKTQAQVAIRWLLQTKPVSSVIIGTTKIHQLEDNCGAVGWRMTDEEMTELNTMTQQELVYPHSMAVMLQYGRDKDPAFV